MTQFTASRFLCVRKARAHALRPLAVAALSSLLLSHAPLSSAQSEHRGVFASGSAWQIRVPANWNGVVVNDLDAVTDANSAKARYFLESGIAFTGTGRPPDRETNHNPLAELEDQARVLDIFASIYGKPRITIQSGCSGGGFTSLAMAELYPDKVDGVVAFNARGTGGLAVANLWLDLPFVLKALIAPNSSLPVAPIPIETRPAALAAWRDALSVAQATPEGRARIALAVTLSQWPTWSSSGGAAPPKPDMNDLDAVQQAMFRSASDGVASAIGRRALYDNPRGLASWNYGIDYRKFYADGADKAQRETVTELYANAHLRGAAGVQEDLNRINASARFSGTFEGVNYWRTPGRLIKGDIKVPMLQLHGIGDALLPPVLTTGYQEGIAMSGKQSSYRFAPIETAGHCTHNAAEIAAGTQTMIKRLETGQWGDTSPEGLNAVGLAANRGVPRFVHWDLPKRFNRAFFPQSLYPVEVTCSHVDTARQALGAKRGTARYIDWADIDCSGVIAMPDVAGVTQFAEAGGAMCN